jgi:hypothetical protein
MLWDVAAGATPRKSRIQRLICFLLPSCDDAVEMAVLPADAATKGDTMLSPRVHTTLLAMLMLIAPALAWAQAAPLASFSTARVISSAGQDAESPRVGIDAAGNAVLMWTRFDGTTYRVQARVRSAAGVLSAVQTVSPAGEDATLPVLAVNASGAAVFAWLFFDGSMMQLKMRARSAAGALSPVQTVSPSGRDAQWPAVAIDSSGRALVAWQGHDGTFYRIRTRALSAEGVLGAMQTLSAAGEAGWTPDVAIDSNDRAIVTWFRHDGTWYRVEARTRSAGGSVGPVETLSPEGASASFPRVAIAPDRTAIFTWARGGTNIRVQAVARSATGELSDVQTLSAVGENANRPRVAVDAAGNAVFVWYRSDGTNQRVQTRARTAAGVLSPVQTLSPAGDDSGNPELAVDASGNAVFVWERVIETIDGTTAQVQARARSAAGTLGVVRTLASSAEDGMVPVVVAHPDGDIVFAWNADDGTNWRIYVATGTLP